MIFFVLTAMGPAAVHANDLSINSLTVRVGGGIDRNSEKYLNSEVFFIQNNDFININPLPQKSLKEGLTSFTGIASIISLITSTILIIRGL